MWLALFLGSLQDGTSTQVAACMINKWMAKINGEEIYITRGPPRMREKEGREGER